MGFHGPGREIGRDGCICFKGWQTLVGMSCVQLHTPICGGFMTVICSAGRSRLLFSASGDSSVVEQFPHHSNVAVCKCYVPNAASWLSAIIIVLNVVKILAIL